MLRVLKAFFPAVLLSYVAASIAATQTVLWHLASMGVEVPLRVRLVSTVHDLLGLASTYLLLILVAMTAGFAVAGLLGTRLPASGFLYPIAGFVSILVLHMTLEAVFGVTLLAAARSFFPGLLLQCLAGAAGGALFAALLRR